MVDDTPGSERQLSTVLKVTSNVTRRSILITLAQQGPTRVTDLARRYAMSLNAVSKHIKALEKAGLVERTRLGREHLIAVNLDPVKAIDHWFRELRSIWEIRLEKLDNLLGEELAMTELSLTVSRIIPARIERVYNAWLDPTLLAKFMLPGEGMNVPRVETEPREGGRFTIVMRDGDQELPHGGAYRKLEPYGLIVFTWESPYSIDGSTVTLNFTAVPDGTRVDLHHVRFLDEASRDGHAAGWAAILKQLETAVT